MGAALAVGASGGSAEGMLFIWKAMRSRHPADRRLSPWIGLKQHIMCDVNGDEVTSCDSIAKSQL